MEASSVVGYSGAIGHTRSFGVGHLEFFSEEVRISVNVGPNCGVGHLGHSCEVGCSGDNLVEKTGEQTPHIQKEPILLEWESLYHKG